MIDIIKRVLAFLLPILGKAAMQTAADTLTQVAYPDRPLRRRPSTYSRYTSYDRMADYAEKDVKKTTDIYKDKDANERFNKDHGFHDVIMVAFDITGPSQALVYEWLNSNMPATTNPGDEYYVDAWWIADDNAPGDCDSAVFVNKGSQEDSRGFLRRGGFAR